MRHDSALLRRLSDWLTRASIKPGRPGTIKLYEKYGDDLLVVRYRYNRKLGLRYKTVELIVDVKKI